VEVVSWARTAAELGAGEVMITSIDREGTGKGYDCGLTRQIAEAVPVPVIACGGAGTLEHVRQVIEDGQADAVSLASMLHYTVLKRLPEFTGSAGDALSSGFSKVRNVSVQELKRYLLECGIECRWSGVLEGIDD
jgi:cyclase